jgi:putative membrane protein
MQHDLILGWQLNPVLIGSLLTASVLYLLAVGPLRSRLAPGQPFEAWRFLLFFLGIAITYLAEGSPLHDLSERYLFSAHMVQHLILNYICAPLLIWGAPTWILRLLLLNPVMRPIARVLSRPVVAAVVFNLGLSLWHFPEIYDAGLRNSSLHHTQHIVFMILSFISWWPLMSRLPELPKLGYGFQILYLFVTSTLMQIPLFGLITFSDHAFYATYQNAPRVVFDSALEDQVTAGVIMKVLGIVIYSIPLIVIFYKWYGESQYRPKLPKEPLKPKATS